MSGGAQPEYETQALGGHFETCWPERPGTRAKERAVEQVASTRETAATTRRREVLLCLGLGGSRRTTQGEVEQGLLALADSRNKLRLGMEETDPAYLHSDKAFARNRKERDRSGEGVIGNVVTSLRADETGSFIEHLWNVTLIEENADGALPDNESLVRRGEKKLGWPDGAWMRAVHRRTACEKHGEEQEKEGSQETSSG